MVVAAAPETPTSTGFSRLAIVAGWIIVLGCLTVDPVRKLVPAMSLVGLVLFYLGIAAVMFLAVLAGPAGEGNGVRASVVITTMVMAIWVGATIVAVRTPMNYVRVALLTYGFFTPLAFLVPRLLKRVRRDQETAMARRLCQVGTLAAVTAVASLLIGIRLFRPLIDDVAFHSFGWGAVPLISGIFVTAERLARFALLSFVVGLVGLYMGRYRRAAAVTSAASMLALVLSARRYPIVLAVLATIGLAVFGYRRLRAVPRILAGAILAIGIFAVLTSSSQLGQFLAHGSTELGVRADTAAQLSWHEPVGQGAGTSSVGIFYDLRPASKDAEGLYKNGEGIIDRLAIELGLIGLVIGLAWGAALAVVAVRGVILGLRHDLPLRVTVGIFVLLQLLWAIKVHSTFGEPYSLCLFWLAIGFLQTAPDLDDDEKENDEASEAVVGLVADDDHEHAHRIRSGAAV